MNLFSCCIPSELEDDSQTSGRHPAESRPPPKLGIDSKYENEPIKKSNDLSASNLVSRIPSTRISLPVFLLPIASALLIWIAIHGFRVMNFSGASTYVEFNEENDHVEVPLENLKLTDDQRLLIENIYSSKRLHDKAVVDIAAETGMKISPHLVYRYLQSSEWVPTFYGKR
jgi:hypothetical protein